MLPVIKNKNMFACQPCAEIAGGEGLQINKVC